MEKKMSWVRGETGKYTQSREKDDGEDLVHGVVGGNENTGSGRWGSCFIVEQVRIAVFLVEPQLKGSGRWPPRLLSSESGRDDPLMH